MLSTIDILDRAKGANSDYWIAQQLGFKHQAMVSSWRKRGHVGAESIPTLCKMAGIPVTTGLAVCAIEGIKNKEKRAELLETLSFKKARRAVNLRLI
ncbi:hypothetical protein SB751_00005 [Cupriavidus sp. SIMBA_020]|uniref:hypothetical protein n=1 Tax=Cupriavidus sp. SIMBA_020 TaxID=3085766 RepID=UPI00397A80FA